MAFDVLVVDGGGVRALPLKERKALLSETRATVGLRPGGASPASKGVS